jgi:uncharacterized protein with von Willebrand factor type A (vWA) domain
VHAAVQALALLEPGRRSDVYWAGRLTLCGSRDELARYDAVFDAYFGDRPGSVVRRQRLSRSQLQLVASPEPPGEELGTPSEPQSASAAASSVEQLRHRDVRSMTSAEKEQLRALLAALRLPGERRVTRRLRPAHRGAVDGSRTLRAWLAAGGEPARLRRRAPSHRHRRVVLLIDVSGSMDSYADALLRFSHPRLRRGSPPTEVFALGTRLTRLTRELALRDRTPRWRRRGGAARRRWRHPARRAGKQFLDQWGQRGTARGAGRGGAVGRVGAG